jgi:hypothetical protein
VLLVDSPENEAAAMDVDEYRNLARWRRLEVRKGNVDLEDQAFEFVRDGDGEVARAKTASGGVVGEGLGAGVAMLEEVRFSAQIGVQDGLFEACWDCGVGYGAELNNVVWGDESSQTYVGSLLALLCMIMAATHTGFESATGQPNYSRATVDLPKLVMMIGES